jgi:hypothetical protein
VVGGLVASILAGVFLIEAPTGDLPDVALGSATLLVIERIAAFFAAWLFALVVVVRGLLALQDLEDEMNALRSVVFEIQYVQRAQEDQLRRYAMRGERDGD